MYRIQQNFRGGKLSQLCTKHTIHLKIFAVHQVHAIMYCTRQMIQGENFCDWLKNCKNRKNSPSKVLPYTVFGSPIITLNLEGEIFDLSVVVIDPLTSEAILGLDVLTQYTVDLLRGRLITGAGHVVNMCCQNQNTEWKTNLVDVL